MLLNDDLSRRALVHARRLQWAPSPSAGVERRRLFRVGEEKARATSIVRYAPGSRFARHTHPGGEEFLVLEGVFQDEAGEYPAGSYVRNPPASAHAPGSADGCVIFVKLWQFRRADHQHIVRRPGEGQGADGAGGQGGSCILFEDAYEQVRIDEWAPRAPVSLPNPHGLEILVLAGGIGLPDERLEEWSWLRMPAGAALQAVASERGARIWIKSAPLLHETVCAF